MPASEYLAIWGAVTGTASCLVALANLRRDRPKLRITCQIKDHSYKHRKPPSLVVRVVNTGKQPVVVAEINLATKWTTTGWLVRRTNPSLALTLPWSREDDDLARNAPPTGDWDIRPRTKLLSTGEVLTVVTRLDPGAPLGDVRPYVADALGRVSWGSLVSAVSQRKAVEENERMGRQYG